MNAIIDHMAELATPLLVYPLIGLLVVIAGWSVGEAIQNRKMTGWKLLCDYGYLLVLGFATSSVATRVFAHY